MSDDVVIRELTGLCLTVHGKARIIYAPWETGVPSAPQPTEHPDEPTRDHPA